MFKNYKNAATYGVRRPAGKAECIPWDHEMRRKDREENKQCRGYYKRNGGERVKTTILLTFKRKELRRRHQRTKSIKYWV